MLREGKFLDPKNDYAFKRIFGREQNKDILIPFLNQMLKEHLVCPIEDVRFLPTVQDPEIASKKQSIVDVFCQDLQGTHYIIEMQVAHSKDFIKRAQYYASKAYANQLDTGENYGGLTPVIFFAIVDFIMFPENDRYHSNHLILDKCDGKHNLKDLTFCFLELPKFKKSIQELTTPKDRWAYFFLHAHETKEWELDRISGPESVVKRAYEELNRFGWTEEELATYERVVKEERDARAIALGHYDLGHQKGLQEGEEIGHKKGHKKGLKEGEKIGLKKGEEVGHKKGLEEGIELGRKEAREVQERVAHSLLDQGMPLETIAKTTGLNVEAIAEIQQKTKSRLSHHPKSVLERS